MKNVKTVTWYLTLSIRPLHQTVDIQNFQRPKAFLLHQVYPAIVTISRCGSVVTVSFLQAQKARTSSDRIIKTYLNENLLHPSYYLYSKNCFHY